jgi:hypothetical protein
MLDNIETPCLPVSFYGGKKEGLKLTNPSNYPEEIVSFLNSSRALYAAIIEGGYSTVIEAGCMDIGFVFEACVKCGVSYLGIDVVAKLVEDLEERIATRHTSSRIIAKAICQDISNVYSIVSENHITNGIVIFPFNSFGNLSNPVSAIKAAAQSVLDIAIFTYGTDNASSQIRRQYYNNCNYSQLFMKKDAKGIFFSSKEGLYSYAYSKAFLNELLFEFGYKIKTSKFARIGRLYIGKL